MNAEDALRRFMDLEHIDSVIDIGSGNGHHTKVMRAAGKTVTAVSLRQPCDVLADYLDTDLGPVDGIWASHVLEHQPDPGRFLRKCFADLKDDGALAVTVPPAKHQVVGGHVTIWNAGLLLYNLILAGFDCSKARVGTYGYNISVIVRKRPYGRPALVMDGGDIESLAPYFPLPVVHGFDGRIGNVRW